MKKVSINFSDEEYQILSELLFMAKKKEKNITMSLLIKTYLYFQISNTSFDYPLPDVTLPKDRGQGRKKGSKNNKHNSEQDVFRVNRNSLAPYGGLNLTPCVGLGGLEDAE
jgi:hypothetical protein